MSPVEVRTLGQFVNLKKVQEKCEFFFQEVSSRFTSDEYWKGAKVCPMPQNSDKHRVEGCVTRCTQIWNS